MEGYMDVIMAHQYGVANAVASMGTAITETQVNILKKLTKNLFLSLDADAAGEEAMLRTVGYENVLNAEIRVIILPEGKDPDEVIKGDIEDWNSLVETAVPLIDFMFEKTAAPLNLNTAGDKSKAVDRLLPVLAAVNDPIRQAHYLQKLATLVKVDMNAIKVSLNQLKRAGRKYKTPSYKPSAVLNSHSLTAYAREEYLLALLLQNPEYKNPGEDISAYIEKTENREIFHAWQSAADINALKERLDPAIHEHLDIIMNRLLPAGARNDIEGRLADCIGELKRTYLKNIAARRAESVDMDREPLSLEEDVKISHQLLDLDLNRARKRKSSFGRARS